MSTSVDRVEISCSLNDKEFQIRREKIRRLVLSHLLKSEKMRERLVLTFAEGEAVRANVYELMSLEKQCCQFLDLTLDSVDEDTFTLTIEGPPGFELPLNLFTQEGEKAVNKSSALRRKGITGIVVGAIACLVCCAPFIFAFLGMGGVSLAITALPLKQLEVIGVITVMLGIGIYIYAMYRMRRSSSSSTCCKSCK